MRSRRAAPAVLLVIAVLAILAGTATGAWRPGTQDLRQIAVVERNPRGAEPCRHVRDPAPKHKRFKAPRQVIDVSRPQTAIVRTNCGSFRIKLDAGRAPLTVNSFAFLAKRGFYDGLTFHRAVRGFVIQGGDPVGDGTGGPGYRVREKPPGNLAYKKGVVAMAKASAEAPGQSGSQFFVKLTDVGLPPEYALLGRVTVGMQTVERIGRLGTSTEEPRQTVLIRSIEIESG